MGKCEIKHHKINLTDTIPVYVKQYPIPYINKGAEIEALKLIRGELVRQSTRPYNAPVFLVDKKAINGVKRKRMVVDYRGLNKKTLSDPYCLPNITEIFDEIGKNTYYTAIDISQGFHNIPVLERDIHKTAWTLPGLGRFEYKVMPFGLKNVDATYQRDMTYVFHDMMHDVVEDYMDDLLSKSKTREQHWDVLERVFACLLKHNVRLNPKKCVFGVTSGKLLGFIISKRGIEVDPKKVIAITSMPPPHDLKTLRSLQGKIQAIRCFIA